MKKIYRTFGPLLTILFTPSVFVAVVTELSNLLPQQCHGLQLPQIDSIIEGAIPLPPPWYENLNIFPLLFQLIPIFLLISFVVGIIYFAVGCMRYFSSRSQKKDKTKIDSARLWILRGGIGISLSVLLFFVIMFEVQNMPLCL